jgi:hypothetical protein
MVKFARSQPPTSPGRRVKVFNKSQIVIAIFFLISRWQLEGDQLRQPSSESIPRVGYPRRGDEPGESCMPYGDLCQPDLVRSPSNQLLFYQQFPFLRWARPPFSHLSPSTSTHSYHAAEVDVLLEVRPFEYALRLVPRPYYFGAALGLERTNQVGASASHMFGW